MKATVEVDEANELQVDQMKLIHVKDKRIFDDRCTHKGGSLAGGAMIWGSVQCPWQGRNLM
jgi:nitrite reductase/ring-hydroxylating ferredoxin subunit